MKCIENVNLKGYNTYKINGFAKYMYIVDNPLELVDLLNKLSIENTKYFVIGGGSNIIIPDEPFNGAIIKIKFNTLTIKDNIVYVDAGYNLNKFIKNLIDQGFVNFSNLYGIPGTIGGAIHGNAGANNMEIFDCLKSVLIYSDGNIKLINKENIKHSYRFADFNENVIILGAIFTLIKGSKTMALEKIKENIEKRNMHQPLRYPSAGSVFKNPDGLSAGKLIDDCGLKNLRVGGAKVSNKHANFIINLDNATSSDIIKLIQIMKKEVKSKKNIELTLEQKIVKW